MDRLKTKSVSLADHELILCLLYAQHSTWHMAGTHMFAEVSPRAKAGKNYPGAVRTERLQCQIGQRELCRTNSKNTTSKPHNSRQRTLITNTAVTDLKSRSDGVGSAHQHLLRSNPIAFPSLSQFDFPCRCEEQLATLSGEPDLNPAPWKEDGKLGRLSASTTGLSAVRGHTWLFHP